MKKIFFALLGLSLFLFACDDEPTVDLGAPSVNFILPLASSGGEYFTDTNNIVTIKATVTDNDELHNIYFVVTNTYDHGNGETVEMLRESAHSHGTSYSLNKTYMIDTACHSDYYFKIIASDHNDNVSRDSVYIHVHGKKGEECL